MKSGYKSEVKRALLLGITILAVAVVILFVKHNIQPRITPAEYVDSRLCANCHASIYETYKHTGMARPFYIGRINL
jgi:hypothetical protein